MKRTGPKRRVEGFIAVHQGVGKLLSQLIPDGRISVDTKEAVRANWKLMGETLSSAVFLGQQALHFRRQAINIEGSLRDRSRVMLQPGYRHEVPLPG
jgi:hypothetical protein